MSKKMSRYPSERKVYVGDLGSNARKDDIEYAFSEYGPICSVWVARNPPGFAFVEFEDARDAADAVRQLSGRSLFGRRIRVELSTVGRRNDRNKRNGRYDEGNLEEKCFDCGVRGHYARECRRYVRARRRNDEANNRRSPSASRGRRTPSPRATRSRSRSGSRHRNSISTTHTRRERHERRKKETKPSRERDLKRSRERESRYSDEEKKHEYRKNGRRPPSPDAPKKRGYGSRSPSVNNSSDSRSGSDSDESSRRGGDDSSVSYSPRSNSRKN